MHRPPAPSIEAIFFAALSKGTPEERAAYVQEACGGDGAVRRQVERLLNAQARLGNFLEEPVGHDGDAASLSFPFPEPPVAGAGEERPGTVIGPYKLLEQIGEGGFGVVFLAEQQQPVRRRVALKVLKPGMDTRRVIARFEAERQALALMDHPHIARVFDGGTTASGRPYFVMELVRGISITDYCDQNQLTVKERLELFVSVCQAVQHAHTKGIIHRDLKPSNVLVTLHDGTPVAKVIDFGVAKALGQQLTDKTLYTGFLQLVGTPLYMSPEQAALSGLDVDTRSDIYSLGVLLYELLTGATPFDRKRFLDAGYDEIRRIIREEEPPKPSTRISTLGETAAAVCAQRKSDPKRLSQFLRGELDWIVMKALEKDRSRRYETASALAADVQRYLHDEPVLACPPSRWYRFRKLARRHKTGLAIAVLVAVFLAVLAGGIGGVVRDRAARQAAATVQADLALREATRFQEQGNWPEALSAVKRAEGILAVGADPQLDRRVQALRRDLEMVIKLEDIRLQSSAGRRGDYDFAGRGPAYDAAFREYGIDVALLEPMEAGERIRRTSIPDELVAALDDWAFMVIGPSPQRTRLLAIARAADPERNQLREALERGDRQVLKELAASERVLDLPPSSLKLFGDYLLKTGNHQEAVDLLRKAQWRHVANFWINESLAAWLGWDHPDEAIGFARAALALRPKSPHLYCLFGLALLRKGLPGDAELAYRKAIEIKPNFGWAHVGVVSALIEQRKYAEANEASAQALKVLPEDDVGNRNNLAWMLASSPEPHARDALLAVEVARKAIERAAVVRDPAEAAIWNTLGVAHYRAGNWKDAVAALEESMARNRERRGGYSVDWFFLAMAHWRLGDKARAGKWYTAARLWMDKHDPTNAELRRFRAEAAALLGLPDQPPEGQAQPKPEEVVIYTLVLEAEPEAAAARGAVYAVLGQWDKAAADMDKAVRLNADQADLHYLHALACLGAGDRAGYRSACAAMLGRFGRTEEPEVARWVAWTSVLAPDAVKDLDLPVQLAERAVRADPSNGSYTATLGCALYRARRFSDAIEQLREASAASDRDGANRTRLSPAYTWFFLAMAHHRSGHAEEARQCLDKAIKQMEQETQDLSNDPGKYWNRRLTLQLLRREAEGLLTGPAGDPPEGNGQSE
jgi:serine/threonine protein kinase/uncharacterized protein HemY